MVRRKVKRVVKCGRCMDTGVVAVYGEKTVEAVLAAQPVRCAIRSAVACTCPTAVERFREAEIEQLEQIGGGEPLTRYAEKAYCPLPHLGYVPNTGTLARDYSTILDWADRTGVRR